MNRRRAVAVLALVGALDSTYLLLAKLGYIGDLSCGISHGCDTVNTSAYSSLLGLPVAGIGVAGYLVLFAIAIAGVQLRYVAERWPDQLLSVLSGGAVAFTLYLTYAEMYLLRAVCQWCVLSQIVIVAIFALSLAGLLTGRRSGVQSD